MEPLSVIAAGMVTGVGFDAPSTCAAIRAGVASFVETPLVIDGEPVLGSAVPFDAEAEGIARLVRIVAPAVRACLDHADAIDAQEIPLLLGISEPGQPGRPEEIERRILADLSKELGVRFHETSRVLPVGRVAGARGVALAAELIQRRRRKLAIVAGVDSLLAESTLAALYAEGRVIAHGRPDGFVPGEAGAAVLLGAPRGPARLVCLGVGFGREDAVPGDDRPPRADGLTAAVRAALRDSGRTAAEIDYRIADASGEQRAFKEAALAAARLRSARDRFDLWLPAESTGEIGAAFGPLALGMALAAAQKGYAPGSVALLHFAGDGGERAALLVHAPPKDPPR